MIYVKVHRSYRTVIAICDKDIIGKKFEEGKKQLEISENFFKGDEMEREEVINLIEKQVREDSSFNIVGKEAVEIAKKAGLIDEENVGYVQGIPLVLVF